MREGNNPIQAKAVNCLLSGELFKGSYDHYSPALIPFYFISLPSLTFPQKILCGDNVTAIDSFLLMLVTLLLQVTLY